MERILKFTMPFEGKSKQTHSLIREVKRRFPVCFLVGGHMVSSGGSGGFSLSRSSPHMPPKSTSTKKILRHFHDTLNFFDPLTVCPRAVVLLSEKSAKG